MFVDILNTTYRLNSIGSPSTVFTTKSKSKSYLYSFILYQLLPIFHIDVFNSNILVILYMTRHLYYTTKKKREELSDIYVVIKK